MPRMNCKAPGIGIEGAADAEIDGQTHGIAVVVASLVEPGQERHEFNLCYIQPTPVLRGVMYFKTIC